MSRTALALILIIFSFSTFAEVTDSSFAQDLVDATLAAHPEVAHVVLHVTPPGRPDSENTIIASNIGRIGKLADEDDLRIMHSGNIETVVAKTGDRYNVSQALHDSAGNTIGVVAIGFPYQQGDDKHSLQSQAVEISNEISLQIPSAAALFGIK